MAKGDPRRALREAAERTLTGLELLVQRSVQQALDQVAADYAASLAASGWPVELVAQGEPVDDSDARRVADLWLAQLTTVMLPLLAVYGAAAAAAWRWLTGHRTPAPGRPGPRETPRPAEDPDENEDEDPDEDAKAVPRRRSHDLVDTYLEDPLALPDRVRAYLEAAENRLRDVGDDLWRTARQALADGVAAGDTMDQQRDRLKAVFTEGGVELGDVRARRIARTELLSAWNWAALDEARSLPEDARPLSKEWLSTLDLRTRSSHFIVDGAQVPLDAPFMVGGEPLMFPGDPLASPGAVINCRCALLLKHDDDELASDQGRQFLTDEEIAEVITDFEERGFVREKDITAASGGPHTGAMVALVPSPADIDRLAVPGGLPPDELHLTLLFLGDAADIPDEARAAIVDRLRGHIEEARAAGVGAVEANGFAISAFNPNGEEPCIVLGVGGGELSAIHDAAVGMVVELYAYPEQHDPWAPHVTLTYTDDLTQVPGLADRAGPITFDRLRVVFGDQVTDIPLAQDEGATTMPEVTADALPPRTWSTPDGTALAYEDEETGDGRIFAPGALYWSDGPWPLQYADQMLGGHDGAQLAGSIETITRDGGRIPSTGVLYPGQPAGREAIDLLEEGAPLGISVDLDDVDMELIDRRPADQREADDEDGVVLLASLASASFLRLADGTWAVRATQVVEWTTGDDGNISKAGLRAALTAAGLTAAAGDTDDRPGDILFAEAAGDYVMRITRARVRGATLVSMPAFAGARIVLDSLDVVEASAAEEQTACACSRGGQDLAALGGMPDLEASAWAEFRSLPDMPAAWFTEPTPAELGTEDGPVHYADGRIWGWVAQRGVCHDGYTGQCLTIDQLGDVDTSTFLRSRVRLDDGQTITAGVFTMNTGHDNDGTDAASTRALFDNTRTVAGIVTVGSNDHGMWFSGAAAPWLSEWDLAVFASCAPSGHWRQERDGRWSLRAVLSVPVPGYPTRLAASAIARANLALTAAAAPPSPSAVAPVVDIAVLASAVVDEMEARQAARAEVDRLIAELAPVRAEIAASLAAQIHPKES